MTRKIKACLLGALVLALAGCMTYTNNQVTAVAQITPLMTVEYDDSGTCPCPSGFFRIKFDNPSGNTSYTASHGGLTVTIKLYGGANGLTYVDWQSNLGIDQVIVKGGDDCSYYVHDEAKSGTGLKAPPKTVGPKDDPKTIQPDISFVAFCWDAELEISKTVATEFTRYWDWDVEKSVEPTAITINKGESGTLSYTIVVKNSYEDKDFKVSGTITIYNPAPVDASVTVVDEIEGIGEILNVTTTIPANDDLELSFGPVDLQDGSTRKNKVTVTSHTSGISGGTLEVPIEFGDPTDEVDEKAKLEDAFTLPGGLVLWAVEPPGSYNWPVILSKPKTFEYSLTIKNESLCDKEVNLDNLATLTELESETPRESSARVAITAGPCVVFYGCSHGYWKNHTDKWPMPYQTGTTLGSVFANASIYGLDKDTFLKALNYRGGSTLTGAAQLLLMQAVAAVLNAKSLGDKFPYTVEGIIAEVNAALASKNRTTILNLKDKLDAANNLGCPF